MDELDKEPQYGWPIRKVLLWRSFDRTADVIYGGSVAPETVQKVAASEMGKDVLRLRREVREEKLRQSRERLLPKKRDGE